jgi:autotransporter-associated beta strand protein
MLLIDNNNDGVPESAFSWDTKGSGTDHQLELNIPDPASPNTTSSRWNSVNMIDRDGNSGTKTQPDFNTIPGHTDDGYIRLVSQQDGPSGASTTTFVEFAVKWAYLTGTYSSAAISPLAPGQTWRVQFGSINDGTDHANINADVAGSATLTTTLGTAGAWSDPINLAVPYTWTGGAAPDANWSNGANWDTGSAPVNGVDLIFPAGPSSKSPVNDIGSGTLSTINSVTIADSGYDVTSTSGSTLTITNGFVNSSSSGVANWRIKLSLSAAQTFSTTTASASTAFFGTWNLNAFTLTISGSGNMDNTAVISGTGGIIKNGAGNLSLANLGNNTYTGKTTVNQGTLFIIQESNLGANPASLTADQLQLNGGTLQAGLDFTIDDSNRGITLGASGGTFSVDSEKTLEVKKIIAGTGNLTKTGPGMLKLSTATSTYTGKTIVSEGALSINNESRLGNSPVTTTADQLTIQNGATLNFFGNTTIDDANRGVTLGTGGGIISVDESTSCEIKRPIAGTGSLTKVGLGELKLSTVTSTYTGKTIISEGTLMINSESRLGDGTGSFVADQLTILNGAMLNIFANTTIDDAKRGISLGSGGGIISVDDGISLEMKNVITGAGSLTKVGNGSLKLSTAANTYTGKTIVTAGILMIDNETRLGNNPASSTADQLTISGGSTLEAFASFTIDDSNRGILLGAGGGIITVDDTFTLAIANPIDDASGGYALTKAGLGTLTLSATSTSTYSGATTVSEGRLNVNGSLASGSPVTVASGATLGGTGTAAGTVAANGTLAPGNGVGTLNTGAETWNSGGSYEVQINNATGTKGGDPGWDWLNISGGLTVNATSGSKFTIKVVSLSGGSAGNAANFDNTQNYSWIIATASSGVSGFDATAFTIDTSGFSNGQGTGHFVISQSGNNVYLQFGHVTAGAVSVSRAWGTYLRIPVSTVLAQTSGGTGDRSVTQVTSSSGDNVLLSGTEILFAPAANVNTTRYLSYTVADSSTPTAFTATGTITVTVTNAVSATRAIINSSGSTVTATFFGMPGFKYQVQRTLSLSPTDWQNYESAQTANATTGQLVITDTVANGSSAWYRLVQAPD